MAIPTVVIAGVWQSSGFVMALFLAGLRGIDDAIIKAAMVDGASLPTIYRRIVIPALRPVFFSVLLVLGHIAIKSFDLVMALTAGGPGNSTDLPAIFMYQFSFTRGQLGLGAASAVMMLATVLAVLEPAMAVDTFAPKGSGNQERRPLSFGRVAIYVLLVLVALYYLAPLYVMITTSLKSLDEIRTSNLLALPHAPTIAAWGKAWDSACTGVDCG
eukprot:gene16794-21232_t